MDRGGGLAQIGCWELVLLQRAACCHGVNLDVSSWACATAGEEQVPAPSRCGNCCGLNLSQVPVPLKDNRKRFLAMKWLITECRENKNRRTLMPEKLSQELLQAFKNEGPVIKKKHVLHKMAEANRAYAHFRWW